MSGFLANIKLEQIDDTNHLFITRKYFFRLFYFLFPEIISVLSPI